MIDTIHITLDTTKRPNQSFIDNLDDCTIQKKVKNIVDKTTVTYKKGIWNNFNVVYYDNYQLKMKGSLAKYFFNGHNLKTLDRLTIKKAIEKMSNEIGLPINEGKIKRIDIGDNFFVTKPVNEFTTFFGSLGYFPKSVVKNGETIYMGNKTRKIIFYDKIKEMDSKKVDYPKTFKGQETANAQILRYEVRILKVKKCSNIQKILNKHGAREFLVELLYDKNFYNALVDIWLDLYESIPKINTIVSGTTKINSVGTLKDYLAFLGTLGMSYDFVLNAIEARKDGITGKQYHDMKKELIRIAQNAVVSEIDPAIKSLTDKIRLAGIRQKKIDRWTKDLELTYFVDED